MADLKSGREGTDTRRTAEEERPPLPSSRFVVKVAFQILLLVIGVAAVDSWPTTNWPPSRRRPATSRART